MATACGKAARKAIGGNRFTLKRAGRAKRHDKIIADNNLTPEAYRAMKLQHRKELSERRRERR